ncbi:MULTISPECIES: N-acetyltransferase [unclassified Streptomyces]|uniref:GNAT family N-acetyltransferase n=1 Tax=unclassified Streptomyces TaxID=2593676 RepID=UPI00278BB6C6|nr:MULTISPECIES: GNAT family N-acetyltransferase [unclassified Streptomyces]
MPFDLDRPAPANGVKYRTEHGYILAGPDQHGCCVIHELWVAPGQRGSGVGRALVDRVRAWARGRGLRPLIVHCSPGNQGGRAFYEALGMRAVSVVYQDDLADEADGR